MGSVRTTLGLEGEATDVTTCSDDSRICDDYDDDCVQGVAISGAAVGSWVWWRRPQSRLNTEEYIQYKAMLISLATHLLLLMFELLAADNLDTRRHKWILVFIPLTVVR